MIPRTTGDELDTETFPMTTEEVLERYGDARFDLDDCSERIADALDRTDDEVYHSPDEVRLAVYNGVSSDAIGRPNYSDRDPTPLGAMYGPDQLSF